MDRSASKKRRMVVPIQRSSRLPVCDEDGGGVFTQEAPRLGARSSAQKWPEGK